MTRPGPFAAPALVAVVFLAAPWAQGGGAPAEVSGEPIVAGRSSAEFTTLPDLINPSALEEEITGVERRRLELEREQREAQEQVARAQRLIEREAVDLDTYGYNLEVTHRRLEELALRAEAKRARIELYRGRLRHTLEPITLGAARALGAGETAAVAAAQRYTQQIAILAEDLGALESEIAALERYRRREHELIALADRNIGQHAARLDRRQSTLEQIRAEMASSEARLDALITSLETITPSVLLPQAMISDLASIELPPPGPPPEPSSVASLAGPESSPEEAAASGEPPVDLIVEEPALNATPEEIAYRSLEELAREASEELQLGDPVAIDMEAFAGTQGLAIGSAGEGLEIETPPGAVIRAPRGGSVIYTGPLEGYGDVVITQHDDDSLSVLASVSEVEVAPGARVEFGTPVARAGTLRESGAPGFHFEVRRAGETIDPITWLGEEALRAAMIASVPASPDQESP